MTQRGAEFWTSGAIPIIGPEVLISIVGSASDVAIVLSPGNRVASVMINPASSGLAKFEQCFGESFLELLTVESVPKFQERAALLQRGGESRQMLELNHIFPGGEEVPMQYTVYQISSDGSLLMLGRDMRPMAELQQQLIESQKALEHDYEIQREAETRLRVIMESSDQALVFASLATGRITMVNQLACDLLGAKRDNLLETGLTSHFVGMRGDIMDRLVESGSEGLDKSIDLTVKRNDIPIKVSPIIYRSSGERMLFCRLGLPDAARVARDGHSELLSGMFQNAADGIVFINGSGTIKSANEAFLGLCEAPDIARVVGRSLADFLERGSLDVRLIVDNASRTGKLRVFSTRLMSAHGSALSVEISVTAIEVAGGDMYAVTLRDAARESSIKQGAKASGDQHARSVAELVGSASLKEIVAETTDVVEKICIETAVEITRNNRVAAAEMLGLSRQSLYVKLRKYGLLSQDGE